MCVGGSTTEAGTRQQMKQSALPISYDEAENERQKDIERMQAILNLARCSSSDSSAVQMKGTASGSGVSYRMRSCWCFGSIGAGISMAADASRITTLEMVVRNDPDAFESLKKAWADLVNQPSFSNAFISRAIYLAPVIEANFNNFSSILARHLGDKRAADQLGALMAGAYSLTSDAVATEDEAREYLALFDLKSTATESASISDEEGCFNHLMDAKISNGRVERSVSELLTDWFSTDASAMTVAGEVLRRNGIKGGTGCFHVCQNHSELKRIYQNTAWSIQYFKILRRREGAEDDCVRFGGGTNPRRSVKLKWIKPPTEILD
jgi:putative DNA primase/helicase